MTPIQPGADSIIPGSVEPESGFPGNTIAAEIRVRGTVQGVGFRPTVYRLATAHDLRGDVRNDGQGVLIRVAGRDAAIAAFVQALQKDCPPLARIESIEQQALDAGTLVMDTFTIIPSLKTLARTAITADAATCPDCKAEIFNPRSRWHRYPFTNCTHCGPRLSILRAIPYDRSHTSMAVFPMCPECQRDYEDVSNRRFHAQPTACPRCGPQTWLEGSDDNRIDLNRSSSLDDLDLACRLLQRGEILAIKGLGGIHLACDATNELAVRRLRERKHRYHKPFALMARDSDLIEQYCYVSDRERELLESPAAPIVLLSMRKGECRNPSGYPYRSMVEESDALISIQHDSNAIAPSVAPDLRVLGFMLPYTPLHHLLVQQMDRPIVFTSGNLSDEPQCIDNQEARQKLGIIAQYWLLHDRDIVNRLDDSVTRVLDRQVQVLRRARGYAPAPIRLPIGFEQAPFILAMGSELKATFCLLQEGQAILSQHLGDLEHAAAFTAYQQTLTLYLTLFEHHPQAIAIDLHPDYLSSKLGRDLARAVEEMTIMQKNTEALSSDTETLLGDTEALLGNTEALSGDTEALLGNTKALLGNTEALSKDTEDMHPMALHLIQHHHAHVAACMAENNLPLEIAPILGIVLDGLGYGEDGTLWGGEFLLADYRQFQRLACFKPVAMLGGEQAIHQPWRNTYAHLMAAFAWEDVQRNYGALDLITFLENQPRSLLNQMLSQGINSPLASSAGRLFDAVAAALGICRETTSYEGQGAIALETLATEFLTSPTGRQWADQFAYPFAIDRRAAMPILEPRPMWSNLLTDLRHNLSTAEIAARFHMGLAQAIAILAHSLRESHEFTHVALTGGVFQNRILHQHVSQYLSQMGLIVLTHHHVPPNDGGVSLGQVAIAAARTIQP